MSLESQNLSTIENTDGPDPDSDQDYFDMSDLVCDEDNCLSEAYAHKAENLKPDQSSCTLHLFYMAINCYEPDIGDFIRSLVVYEFNFENNHKLLKKAVAWYCSGRKSAVDRFGHIAYWNVSKITNFSSLFAKQKHFNDNINTWDMSSAKTTKNMFMGAESFNRPLGKWKMGNVIDMSGMFSDATNFNQPINTWDMSKCEKTTHMFDHANSFNQPLNMWNMSGVKNTEYMFAYARKFNQDISNWDMTKVERLSFMFINASSFDQDISEWNLFYVMSMRGVFMNAKSFRQYPKFIRKIVKIWEGTNRRSAYPMNGYIGHNYRMERGPYTHLKEKVNAEIRKTIPLVIY